MIKYRTYIMQTWIATVLTTPFIYVSLFFLIDPGTAAGYPFFGLVFFLIFFGFAISIPTLLLLGLAATILERKFKEERKLKIATIFISILFIIASLLFFSPDFEGREWRWVMALATLYIVAIIGFGSYYKIKKVETS